MNVQAPEIVRRPCVAPGPVGRVEALLARRSRDRQIALLGDTRVLHRLLACLSQERRPAGSVGRYRAPGEPVYVVVGLPAKKPMISNTCPADRVAQEMERLSLRIHALLTNPPTPEAQRKELAAILATFFRIHPYRDGNGRVARILICRAAKLLGQPLNDRWTLERGGYGPAMSLAVESYHLSPKLLEAYLARFFDKN